LRLGGYELTFNLSSRQLWKDASLLLRVMELPPVIGRLEAERVIREVEEIIEGKRAQGYNVTIALDLLGHAYLEFDKGNWSGAKELAEKAKLEAEKAHLIQKPRPIGWLILISICAIGLTAWIWLRIGKLSLVRRRLG
jgi:hypothetical protein